MSGTEDLAARAAAAAQAAAHELSHTETPHPTLDEVSDARIRDGDRRTMSVRSVEHRRMRRRDRVEHGRLAATRAADQSTSKGHRNLV